MLKWARQNGCPWDERTFFNAAGMIKINTKINKKDVREKRHFADKGLDIDK
jgi:hypothetical protein